MSKYIFTEFYEGSDGVLLVAVSSRQPIITDTSESQLGVAYRRARRKNGK